MHDSIANLPAKAFAGLLSGPMLTVVVGPERKQWTLHRDLLRYQSSFFDDSIYISGDARPARNGELELLDEDSDAFEILVKWLYQGRIEDVSSMPKDQKWDYAFTCQKLYLLCEKIGIEDLKNSAMDQFRKGCLEACLVPGAEEIQPIYARTEPSSPFRKLVSRIVARQIMDPDTHRDAALYQTCFAASPDFAIDVVNAIRECSGGIRLDDPTDGSSCRFHQHTNGKTCRKTVTFKDGL